MSSRIILQIFNHNYFMSILKICIIFIFDFLLLILGGILILTSCKHEPLEKDYDLSPMLRLIEDVSYVSSDTTLQIGTPFSIEIQASGNTIFNKNITRFSIWKINETDSSLAFDSTLSSVKLNSIRLFQCRTTSGSEKWRFEIIDQDGRKKDTSFTITAVNNPPNISFISGNNYTVNGSTINFSSQFKVGINANINAMSGGYLKQFNVYRTINNLTTDIFDTIINSVSFTDTRFYTTSNQVATEKWYFKITDNRGESKTIILTIFTAQITPLNCEFFGVLYNSIGPFANSWDLISDASILLTAPDSSADMQNTTTATSYAPYYFFNSWRALNTTRFKRLNYFSYENAIMEDAVDAYSGTTISQPSSYANTVSTGIMYVAKLRGKNNYIIIRVNNVIYTDSDSLDRIEFSYKKACSK